MGFVHILISHPLPTVAVTHTCSRDEHDVEVSTTLEDSMSVGNKLDSHCFDDEGWQMHW